MDVKERLVVIGNGMAGARFVEELLARGGGERYRITVFGEEPGGSYNRVLLSGVLNGSHDPREIMLYPPSWYAENDVILRSGERVIAVDREARLLRTASGEAEPYDRLVFATGSRAAVPPLEGLRTPDGRWKPGVFVFRTLDDCRRIAGFASKCATAAVVGGGLLGLEAAYGLKDHGVQVTVVQQAGHLMNQQLDPQAGAILRRSVERMGVRVLASSSTQTVLGKEEVTGLVLSDGTELPCQMVVLACGIRPNVELAAECGLSAERGIVVDDRLGSVEDPRVYAVGECAQHRGQVYGLVAPLWEQAAVLADHLAGTGGATYTGSRVATRLKVMGMEVASLGEIEARDDADEVVQYSEPGRGVYKKLVIRDGVLVGGIVLGDGERVASLLQAFDRRSPLPEDRASLLFDFGVAGARSLGEMPDDETVCHCNGVSKGEIRECLEGGACGLHGVMRATRACTGCGSCKTLVRGLVDLLSRGEAEAQPVRVGAAA